jgi:hypothetical protein
VLWSRRLGPSHHAVTIRRARADDAPAWLDAGRCYERVDPETSLGYTRRGLNLRK